MKIDMTNSYNVLRFSQSILDCNSLFHQLLIHSITTCIPRNIFRGQFLCQKNTPSLWSLFDEQSLHNRYIFILKKSFKMGIFFNPQHTHPGKHDMKSPPPRGAPRSDMEVEHVWPAVRRSRHPTLRPIEGRVTNHGEVGGGGGGRYKTGQVKFYSYENVEAMLKGDTTKFWGSFYVVA